MKSRQGGKLSLQPVVAHVAAPAVLPLLDWRLKPQCGASQSSVDSSHQQLTGMGLSRSWWQRMCLCVILLWIMTSSRLGRETWTASVRQSRCSTQPREPLLPASLSEYYGSTIGVSFTLLSKKNKCSSQYQLRPWEFLLWCTCHAVQGGCVYGSLN